MSTHFQTAYRTWSSSTSRGAISRLRWDATPTFPVEEAVDVVLQVTEAMGEAHALGIVHRDLKPSNLFVCRVGEPSRRVLKVLDFGISKDETDNESRITASNAYFGTPYYASPEQLRAASGADARSDVWSLGVILFELLTGRTPFTGNPTQVIAKVVADPVPWPTELRPDLSPDLARIVMHALKKNPQERFQNMRELADALAPFGPKQTFAAAVADAPPRGRGRLGEILVGDGLITQADLDRALAEQRQSGKLLGRVLLDLGLVAQSDLLTALAKQQGIIVTPEAPNAVERARREREAPTVHPVTDEATSPPSSSRRRSLWIAGAVCLLVGVIGALAIVRVVHPAASHPALTAPAAPR